MKKLISAVAVLMLTSPAFANIDVSTFKGLDGHKGMECMHQAWADANPTAEQTEAAKGFMKEAKEVYKSRKSAIHQAAAAVKAAWSAHPIVSADVAAASHNMQDVMQDVQHAMVGATINSINLLSVEQRGDFNESFKSCIQE